IAIGIVIALWPQLLERFESHSPASDSPCGARPACVRHPAQRRPLVLPGTTRTYGAAVVILAVTLLSFLAFGQPQLAWQGLFEPANRVAGEILVDTARVILWILGLFALAVGVVVFLRPSALKAFEAWSNRWLTPRRALRNVEATEYHGAEQWVRRHPRGWGVAVALLSAVCLLALILQLPAILRIAG
ncbi:MAG: hypothetical protein U5K33_07570, partial [Halofilum sp. (in: g-proteobacteria)]|nr:hypothetical protein [Halofilum sp. (in: g-proteobacteria)]